MLGYTLVPSPRDMTILYLYIQSQRSIRYTLTEVWSKLDQVAGTQEFKPTQACTPIQLGAMKQLKQYKLPTCWEQRLQPSQAKPGLQGTQRNLNPVRLDHRSLSHRDLDPYKWVQWNSWRITRERSESAREWRIALYKSNQQQQVI